MNKCKMCPRNCGADRDVCCGVCGANSSLKVAKIMLHNWEEPCISLGKGSGAIFFSNCPLKCIFCQNYEISRLGNGKEISVDDLVMWFKKLEEMGAENINLVSPTQYTSQIVEALKKYKPRIPVVWNTNSYEKVEVLDKLSGLIDIFLADLKYCSPKLSAEFSGVGDYFDVATKAILKMREIVPCDEFDGDKMVKGLIVRHLVLPGCIEDSKCVLDWVKNKLGTNTIVSVMNQYVPYYKAKNHKQLGRKVTAREYSAVCDYALNLGFQNGYFQSGESACESYIPNFTTFLD